MDRKDKTREARNKGEGSRTAAREHNQAQQRFVRSGQVEDKARQTDRDRRNDEIRRELEHAEVVGKRHAVKEDPQAKRR
jgi:hypothetical protein